MLIKLSTDKTVSDAAAALQAAVQANHFGVMQGHNLKETMAKKGVEFDEENAELRSMSKRFWIGAALTLPVFVLAMAHMVPVLGELSWVDGDVSRWIQFVLTIPVVCWAGWPFFQRGWQRDQSVAQPRSAHCAASRAGRR